MSEARWLTIDELQLGLDPIRQSPRDRGAIELIVRRPVPGQREVVDAGELSLTLGLVGDCWKARGYRKTSDGSAHPDMQLTLMNSRTIALLAQRRDRWALAGDQLYVDLDLSVDNLPPGTRLAIGTGIVEVTAEPHTGCRQFSNRFGKDATRFVNSPEGKQLRLRGLNAKVVQGGAVSIGDLVSKFDTSA